MKVIIVGATGAIAGAILQYVARRNDITQVVALTRRPLPDIDMSDKKVENVIIQNFGDLESVQDETWEKLQDADAIVWGMGTYTLDEDVNLKYPLAFQEKFLKRQLENPQSREGKKNKFKFIYLSGAFVEPDQSRRLYVLGDQRRMKGLLQTKMIEFAEAHNDIWEAFIIRPGQVHFGNTLRNRVTGYLFGSSLTIRSEELAAFVADLVVNGADNAVIENREMVERGRTVLHEAM
ncbi:hypothetical protein N0V83_003829 [Neocucurbitaria cava]|uniref:NAD(P)-binding domain-containing protein n=1 Tax=Neocucurbitaria cava TaxID=798079 RepID=A0A9W8Y9L5_9PLEO|nr:hypothetical protein N0V83_003829 [Neocucurbitaria cava]